MPPVVVIQSKEGETRIEFSHPRRDDSGTEHCRISGADTDFRGIGHISFHPGEASLVEFFRSVRSSPPIYRTDRYFTGQTVEGANLCLGKHDSEHVGLTVDFGAGHWRATLNLVLTPEQIHRAASELAQLLGYDEER